MQYKPYLWKDILKCKDSKIFQEVIQKVEIAFIFGDLMPFICGVWGQDVYVLTSLSITCINMQMEDGTFQKLQMGQLSTYFKRESHKMKTQTRRVN